MDRKAKGWLDGLRKQWAGEVFFLMVSIYDFEAMEWTKIMSVDDLTCLRWPCLPPILASYWTKVTIPASWLVDVEFPSSLIILGWCLDPDTINWLVSSSLEFSSSAWGEERRPVSWVLPTHHDSHGDRMSWDPIDYNRESKIKSSLKKLKYIYKMQNMH